MRERRRKNYSQGYKSNFTLGRASKVGVIFGIIFTLGLLYLSQSNAISLKGYKISDLEKQKEDLTAEKERLEIEAARLQSIQEIQKSQTGTDRESMVPVKNIKYLPAASVAVK